MIPAACVSILPFVNSNYTGIEIGVFKGDSSIHFLRRCSFMYLIDPCVPYNGNPDTGYFSSEEQLLTRLSYYAKKFVFIKSFSVDAADQIPIVDFVFVDGNHEYQYVKQDLETYWPKVKRGGFMSGHDYDRGHCGVVGAVDEFFSFLHLPIELHSRCWLVRKP